MFRPKILVAIYHAWQDTSSGAAISLRNTVLTLAARGWNVRVFCGPLLDFAYVKMNEQLLQEQNIAYEKHYCVSESACHGDHLLLFRDGGVRVVQFIPSGENPENRRPDGNSAQIWLRLYQGQLDEWKPQIVLTYGGYSLCQPTLQEAEKRCIKTVFWLCNFAYTDAHMFSYVSLTVTASLYQSQEYKSCLGIPSTPIYPLIFKEKLCEKSYQPKYLTFINPVPQKGVFIFAKIAELLSQRRSDIPLLVVEGRANADWMRLTGAKLAHLPNLYRMRNTPYPSDYYSVSKVVLMSSLGRETFGMVAAEAMMCGIPVIASNGGALPEVIGDSPYLLSIPSKYTPETRILPSAEEVQPWLTAIQQLWDDSATYLSAVTYAKERSLAWNAELIIQKLENALEGVVSPREIYPM